MSQLGPAWSQHEPTWSQHEPTRTQHEPQEAPRDSKRRPKNCTFWKTVEMRRATGDSYLPSLRLPALCNPAGWA
eukprot:2594342-Karenia_brevis.AAC.1